RCRFCVAGLPHIPFAVGFGRSCPSQTCPQTIQCAPRDTSSEPEAEGELPPSVPAVYEALTDVRWFALTGISFGSVLLCPPFRGPCGPLRGYGLVRSRRPDQPLASCPRNRRP